LGLSFVGGPLGPTGWWRDVGAKAPPTGNPPPTGKPLPAVMALAILLLGPGTALADWQAPASVRDAAEKLARAQLAAPGENLTVRAAVDEQLRMPACGAPLAALVQSQNSAGLTASISCAAPTPWSVYVPVQVSRRAEVLVLTRPLQAGEPVTADALSRQVRDVSELPYGYVGVADKAVGQSARRSLPAGTALAPSDLAAPRLVRRGQPVTLVSRVGRLSVRADGQALADGAAGDYIAVQNVNTRRQVRGRIRSGQEVEVDL
jgi:flagella basal body P-ring formation protein FlgA